MAKKPTTQKAPKAVEAPTEAIEAIVEQPATLAPDSGENGSNALPDALELIPTVEVSAEVTQTGENEVEQAVLSEENIPTDQNDADEEAVPECFVLNGIKQPVPAFKDVTTHVYPQELVEKLLYAISLGGEVDIEGCRLQGLPYILSVKVPSHKQEAWETGSEKLEQASCNLYVSFSAPNWFVFVDQLVNAGKSGAIVSPQGVHFKPYIANLLLQKPVVDGAGVSVSNEKPKYTFQELDDMNTRQLKIIGKWYGLEKGTKIDLIPAILKLQSQ